MFLEDKYYTLQEVIEEKQHAKKNTKPTKKQLEKQIKLCDFNNYPNKTLSGLRVIVNPPYKEGAKGNIWIPIIDKLVDSNLASMSLILPVAISSSKRAQFLRNKIFANFKKRTALVFGQNLPKIIVSKAVVSKK